MPGRPVEVPGRPGTASRPASGNQPAAPDVQGAWTDSRIPPADWPGATARPEASRVGVVSP